MKKITILSIGVLVLLSCGQSKKADDKDSAVFNDKTYSNSTLDKDLANWVYKKVDSVMKVNNVPAVSLGVVKDGTLAFCNGFGTKSRTIKIPVDNTSLYQIGSDTKKMTGIIVKNLIKEGKLNLDIPITDYLPISLKDEAKAKLNQVTLLHLLHHQSGIPNRAPSNKRIDGDPMLIPYTEANLLHDLNTINLEFKPGSKFSYSNLGYGVIGYICERVTKKTYRSLIEKYVVKPYEMGNTTTEPTEEQLKKLVTPYRKDNNLVETQRYIMGKLAPAGGVYSNIDDLSKLMIHQIKAYKKDINQDTKSFNPLILTKISDRDSLNYGFGLGKRVFDQGTQYGHGGDMDGFASTYVFSPEFNLGLIMLTSNGGRWIGELEKEILYKLTNRKYIAPKKSIVDFFSKLLDAEGFDTAKDWLETNKDLKDYYLNEAEMNNLGYALLQKKELQKAIAVFRLNTDLFPKSANAFDSLGEAYMLQEDYDMAIQNYKRSLELNPKNENAVKMMDKMRLNRDN